jgi:hypothetical protein
MGSISGILHYEAAIGRDLGGDGDAVPGTDRTELLSESNTVPVVPDSFQVGLHCTTACDCHTVLYLPQTP